MALRSVEKVQPTQVGRRNVATVLSMGISAGIAALVLSGCGNQYRPVVSAISPVGPPPQPTKYAVAVSNPSSAPALETITSYSIAGDVATFQVVNNFTTGASVTLSGFPASTFFNGQVVTVLTASGTQFTANFTHANAAATEAGSALGPGVTLPGLLTFVDVSGDTVLSTPSILPFPPPTTPGSATVAPTPTYVNPNTFAINSSGTQGFIVNSSGTYEDFGLTFPTALLTQNITETTLAAGAAPTSVQALALPTTGTTIFVPEPGNRVISELIAYGPSLLQNLSVPNPVYVVGADEALRVYALSSNGLSTAGQAYPIENTPVSLETPITVGVNPVYGIMTPDDNRAYILNNGSAANFTGSASVINVPSNGPDAAAPTIPTLAITGYSITGNVATFYTSIPPNSLFAGETVTLSGFGTAIFPNGQTVTVSATGLTGSQFQASFTTANLPLTAVSAVAVVPLAHPVWADEVSVYNEIVILNQGDGVHPGSLSIVNVPLCNAGTPVGNPECNSTNPVDAVGFGNLVATVPVGVNPTMVSVLNDGSRAYVVNSGILPGANPSYPSGIEGSVSVVNLAEGVVTATIPATSLPANTAQVATSPSMIYGHPNTIFATTGNPTGKVYVTSTDNKFLTIIETDTDTVDTHISLQGLGIRVYVTQK